VRTFLAKYLKFALRGFLVGYLVFPVCGLALLLSLWCQHSPHFQYAWDLMQAMLFGPFQLFFVSCGVIMALFAIPYAKETYREV
jgi:hypothetical protein